MEGKASANFMFSKEIIHQKNSSTFIMRADSSPNFRNYSIKEDSLLFIDPDKPYVAGKLSMFRKDGGYRLMSDKQTGCEYMGRLVSAINYYF